ncbi:MAG: hypothetical protein RIC15_08995 [Vicingaceae bacterium]
MRPHVIFFLLVFQFSQLMAQDERTFKFSGAVTDRTNKEVILNFMVEVFEGGEHVNTITEEKKGVFQMELQGSSEYMIEISKVGYYPKRALILTNVPLDIKKLPAFKFEMELIRQEEYEDLEKVDPFATSIFDFPYVIFEYDPSLEDLNYRSEYTNSIKKQYQAVDDLR